MNITVANVERVLKSQHTTPSSSAKALTPGDSAASTGSTPSLPPGRERGSISMRR
jgi:hypothetical protein